MRNVHCAILPGWRGLIAVTLYLSTAAAVAATHYELNYEPAAEQMRVQLCIDTAAIQQEFRLHRGGAAHVEGLKREHGTIERSGEARWRAADWRAGECLSYVARIGLVADSRDRDIGSRIGDTLLVAPQQWLLRSGSDEDEAPRVSVNLPPGYRFSPPWPSSASGAAPAYRITPTPFAWSALVAVGRFHEVSMALPGGEVRLALLGTLTAAQRETLQQWIRRALTAAASGYGELPLAQTQVVLLPGRTPGRAVGFGQSLRGQGNAVHLWVDPAATPAQLDSDWTAVHEFAHWAHPYLGDDGAWLSEGLASYWQNVLRARGGLLTAQQAWQQLDAGFARGRRTAATDLGLTELSDVMHARRAYYAVYWAGAAYWLDVDVSLRRASGGVLSVDEALKRFHACCLLRKRAWDAAEFVAKLDALIGSEVFVSRYRAYAARRGFPPLDGLYQELGLQHETDGSLSLVDAPQAAVRDAIMGRR
ncbi:MAG: hypothetical protein JNN30_21980 [Rhodanobacteraceae bacterium]|nr:hypothetical protein [Rhodanobacteraceae bacterium]